VGFFCRRIWRRSGVSGSEGIVGSYCFVLDVCALSMNVIDESEGAVNDERNAIKNYS